MKKIALLVSLLFFLIGLVVLPNYGINWDESLHFTRGQAILHLFLTGNKDYNNLPEYKKYVQKDDTVFFHPLNIDKSEVPKRSQYQVDQQGYLFFLEDYGHPPLSDIFSSFFNVILFQNLRLINDVDSYHVYSLFLASVLVGVVFFWVSRRFGYISGIIATLSLSLYPLFLAESHYNIKDIPETVFFSLTLITFFEGFTNRKISLIILSALFFGFAFSTKFNAVFLPFIIAPWIIIYLYFNKNKKEYLKFFPVTLLYPILGILIFYISWPFLWSSPLDRFFDVVSYYKGIGINTGFDPRFLTFFKINTYAIQWILFSTPLVTLFFTFFGILYFIKSGIREKDKFTLFVILWFVLPIIRVSMPNAGIYGGLRHIMEFVPAMAILSGIGVYYVLEKAATINKFLFNRFSVGIFCVLLFVPITIKIITIHPNEGVYFNPLMGGLMGAKEKKFPEWGQNLGNVHKQGIMWLNRNAEDNAKLATNFGLGSSISTLFLREDIQFTNASRSVLERNGEYILGLTHQSIHDSTYFFKYLEKFLIPVYEVKVDGVAILKIWKNDYEHTKSEYKELVTVPEEDIEVLEQDSSVIIDLNKKYKIVEINIKLDRCEVDQEADGFIQISEDGNKWIRVDGNLQVQRFLAKTTFREDGRFVYYFAGDLARFIKINPENENSCFFRISDVSVYRVN